MSRSSTTTADRGRALRVRTHPGEVLREEFMAPLGLSANALALALRLARYFGTTPEFWLNLQSAYELSLTVAQSSARIERDVHPRAA